MNVIFYSSVTNERTKQLVTGFEQTSHHIGLERHRSLESLKQRLIQPMNGVGLVILYAASKEDMDGLMLQKERLRNFSIIFIMHDTDEDVIRKGRILRPRFIFGPDDHPEEVKMVYERMLERINENASTSKMQHAQQ